jgi:hypothetical protein
MPFIANSLLQNSLFANDKPTTPDQSTGMETIYTIIQYYGYKRLYGYS